MALNQSNSIPSVYVGMSANILIDLVYVQLIIEWILEKSKSHIIWCIHDISMHTGGNYLFLGILAQLFSISYEFHTILWNTLEYITCCLYR